MSIINLKISYLIKVNYPLDLFSDLYPICSKLRHEIKLSNDGLTLDPQFNFYERLFNSVNVGLINKAIKTNEHYDYDISHNLNLRNQIAPNLLFWADVLYYNAYSDKFSLSIDTNINELKNKVHDVMHIGRNNIVYTDAGSDLLDSLRIKEITNDEDYFKKVIQHEKELREQPLTDEEKELSDRDIKITTFWTLA
jgi:hypothetical protein